ncbi:MAG TPA: lysophospholipid acyltransferase family protein [Anaerolineaceae bacterium]|nr:lysophospholipid acyltransferase family protein [Anaerolineaceae bacterium]
MDRSVSLSTYTLPPLVPLTRRGLRLTFRALFRVFARVRVTGMENVPAQGPYVLAFNHVSYFDPPVIVAFWPDFPEVVGADYLWKHALMSFFAKAYGGIPIRRGEVDRNALERIMLALRNRLPVMIAPEGTRSHEPGMKQGKPGIVYLIERTHAPVVPVGIVGTTDSFLKRALSGGRPNIEMRIGTAFQLPEVNDPTLAPKEIRQKKVDAIMEHIAALLPVEYRGVYAGTNTE